MSQNQKEPKEKRKRYVILILVLLAIFIGYEVRLFQWQIIDGETYAEMAVNQDTDFKKLTAPRGEILDKDGNVLAGNKMTLSVEFNAITMEQDRNPALMKVLSVLTEHGEKWIDNLPILIDEEGNYIFDESNPEEVEYLKSEAMLNLQEYATADDCMQALIKRYNCAGYSNEETRNLLSVRYSMHKTNFKRSTPYVIADDVSAETIGIINQMKSELPGVETGTKVTRYYGEDGTVAPHVVGSIGAINEKQYNAELAAGNTYTSENVAGYAIDDIRGQGGIESAFESELRGENGKQILVTDGDGNVTTNHVVQSPAAGNTVQLTIDSGLQKVANESLEKNITGNTFTTDAETGGAVAIDIKTGGVLACSTYPSFDMNRYLTDSAYYKQLTEDDTYPLYSRAVSGTFTPGSVFKPLVAIASLEEHVINTGTTVLCTGVYDYYKDSPRNCLGTHGYVDVYGALGVSCNVFFYDAGRQLRISPMGVYAEAFGLGEYTGIELLEEESKGTMSNPSYFEATRSELWTDGNTISAAIGQLDDSFTPIQLATYCAAIANNGVRLQTHFLDKVYNYAQTEVLEEFEPKVISDPQISQATMDTVKRGMELAASSGTASSVFGNYPVSLCAKTGTAETYNGKSDHLTFIVFAPAEDPEIAISVVMEYGGKGNYAMNVAKDMLDYYFGIEEENPDADENQNSKESSAPESSEVSEDTKEDGANMDIGAFYDPDKDIVKKEESNPEDENTSSEPPTDE